MNTVVHFVDVGQGNMVLIQASDGNNFICDCNIVDDNEEWVLDYLASVLDWGTSIKAFICTHRDADHMRGIKKIHNYFPIQKIWDSGHPGTTTTSREYKNYMDLRRQIGSKEIKRLTRMDFGSTRLRYLSAADERLNKNANAQGIVIKVEHWSSSSIGASAILTGDCDADTWRNAILKDYSTGDVDTSILMAGHHGSITFFDDPSDTKNYYVDHIRAMKPAMTVVSVGDNPHGHPSSKAIELYKKYSTGSNKGNKVFTTQEKGTIRLTMKDEGWKINVV